MASLVSIENGNVSDAIRLVTEASNGTHGGYQDHGRRCHPVQLFARS